MRYGWTGTRCALWSLALLVAGGCGTTPTSTGPQGTGFDIAGGGAVDTGNGAADTAGSETSGSPDTTTGGTDGATSDTAGNDTAQGDDSSGADDTGRVAPDPCAGQTDGQVCDDGDPCTESDTCKEGTCTGTTKVCDDGDVCTTDACSDGACVATPLAAGTTCDDGSACTTDDVCGAAGCVGTILDCDDGKACTLDGCDAATGCTHADQAGACDDGDACTEGDICASGACVPGTPKVCTAEGPCQLAACDPTTGACKITLQPDGTACDDGKACTDNDGCLLGTCLGAPKSCDDGEACTDDGCDAASGNCVHAAVADATECDDASKCTEQDACDSGACKGKKVDCDDQNPCTEDVCEAAAGCFTLPKVGPCDDGDACTLADACTESTCAGGNAKNCDDNNPCTLDGCDAATGGCTHDTAAMDGKGCDDGSACTTGDACAGGSCAAGTLKDCADSQPCTLDGCDDGTGICTHKAQPAGAACIDGSFCTLSDTCDAFGVCTGKPIPCDDGKTCTIDNCDPKTGSCTFQAMPKGASCDDGDACTLADSCDGAGTCNSGVTKNCDDANACTSESCDSKTGDCKTMFLTTPCDDGNACTLGDRCTDGSCKSQGDGDVGTLAGSSSGYLDGATASARFNSPRAVTADPAGGVLVADYSNHRIRRIVDGKVSTLAGNGTASYQDGAAASARFYYPSDVAAQGATVYVADRSNHRIRAIAGGQVSTLFGSAAGNAEGKGSEARLNSPEGVAIGGDGALWVSDTGNHVIRRVDADGILRAAAGGPGGFADGKGPAARFNAPRGIAVDGKGIAYVADSNNHRIRRVLPDGTVTTVAGNASAGYVDAVGAGARFSAPYGIALSPSGVLFVADASNRRIRRVDGNKVSTWSGSGTSGFLDGASAAARYASPQGVAWLPGGQLAVADVSNHRVRAVGSGVIDCDDGKNCTLDGCDNKLGCQHAPEKVGTACNDGNACTAGEACAADGSCSGKVKSCGDDNPCTVDICEPLSGACSNASSQSVCEDGDLCVGPDLCQNGTCAPAPLVQTWVGGSAGYANAKGTSAQLNYPTGLDEAGDGTIYVADRNNHRIRSVLPDGTVGLFAGSGTTGFLNGAAASARFYYPADVLALPDGSVVVADRSNHRIRLVAAGQVTTLSGSGTSGFLEGAAGTARFYYPEGLALQSTTGNILVADSYNNRIRVVDLNGKASTLAGSGTSGFLDGPAATARFYRPSGVTAAPDGLVYVADAYNHRIRVIATNGNVTTLAGGSSGFADGQGTAARFYYPADVALSPQGLLHVADRANHRIRTVTLTGVVSTLLGSGTSGFADGPMASAQFSNPYGILYGNTGLVVADSSNAKLRRLYAGGLQKACDDLDACTTDACDNKTGNCSHQPIANCCQPVKQHWTFGPGSDNTGWTLQKCAAGSSSTPTGCSTVSGASPSKGWQFWDAAKQSNLSAGALYYGDPTPSTPNFNFGASAGAATSPTWVVPASGSKMLASLWWDTEGGTTYDQLFVYLLVDGKIAKTVLQKGTGAYVTSKKWYNLDVDVSAYVGKSVQLQVYFNTKDSVANSGQGIYVDDVKVSAPCN